MFCTEAGVRKFIMLAKRVTIYLYFIMYLEAQLAIMYILDSKYPNPNRCSLLPAFLGIKMDKNIL